jgi:hypothetical protein
MGTQNSIDQKGKIDTLVKELETFHARDLVTAVNQYADENVLSNCILSDKRQSRQCIDNCHAWLERYIFHDTARFAVFIVRPQNDSLKDVKAGNAAAATADSSSSVAIADRLVFVPITKMSWFFGIGRKRQLQIDREMRYQDMYKIYKWIRHGLGYKVKFQELIDVERSDINKTLTKACEILRRQNSTVVKRYSMNLPNFDRTFVGFANENLKVIPFVADQYRHIQDDGFAISVSYVSFPDAVDSVNFSRPVEHLSDSVLANVATLPRVEYSKSLFPTV